MNASWKTKYLQVFKYNWYMIAKSIEIEYFTNWDKSNIEHTVTVRDSFLSGSLSFRNGAWTSAFQILIRLELRFRQQRP